MLETILNPDVLIPLITGIVSSLLTAGVIGNRLKAVFDQLLEAIDAYELSMEPTSEEGEDISEAEKVRIQNEALDVVTEVIEQYGDTWIGKLLLRRK